MVDLSKRKGIKLIALLLSALLISESVVWADPDVFQRQDLQPRMLSDPSDAGVDRASPLVALFIRHMAGFEGDPQNQNISAMTQCARSAVDQLKNDPVINAEIIQSPENSDLIIDLGVCCIRYYNPQIKGAGNPGFPYRIVEEVSVGRYLSRQVLIRGDETQGFISRGEPQELFNKLMTPENMPKDLRASLKERISEIADRLEERFREAISTSERQYVELLDKKVTEAINKLRTARIVEFGAVVLGKEKEPEYPAGWLLGFNTFEGVDNKEPLEELIKNAGFNDTIGLCTQVLNRVKNDPLMLEEYIFHEAVCPYLSHTETRRVQETLYSENYKGIHDVDNSRTIKGHADGELTLVLKYVIWERLPRLDKARIREGDSHEESRKFMDLDFKGDGPTKAARYQGSVKIWLEAKRREFTIRQSRLRGTKMDKSDPQDYLREFKKIYEEVCIRVKYIWAMENYWTKVVESNQGSGDLKDRFDEVKHRPVEEALRALMDEHKKFLRENPGAESILSHGKISNVIVILENRLSFLKEAREREEANRASFEKLKKERAASGQGEIKKEQEEEPPPPALERKVKLKMTPLSQTKNSTQFNWKRLAVFSAAALALSAVLYLVLPVNKFTNMIALALPLALFVYLLIKNWSWKNLFIGIGTTLLLSYFLPVPWLGLSMTLIMLVLMARSGGNKGAQSEAPNWDDEMEAQRAKDVPTPVKPASQVKSEAPKNQQSAPTSGDEIVRMANEKFARDKAEANPERLRELEKAEEENRNFWQNKVAITSDIHKYMLLILYFQTKNSVPASEEKVFGKDIKNSYRYDPKTGISERENTTRIILYNVFGKFRETELPSGPDPNDLKGELRPRVVAILNDPLLKSSYEFAPVIATMRDWRENRDLELGWALRTLYEEISVRIGSNAIGDERYAEGTAIRELICEYFGMDENTVIRVINEMLGIFLKEEDATAKLIGAHMSPYKYYIFGLWLFGRIHDKEAENAFEWAVKLDPENKHYSLALGLVKHYFKKYDEAGRAYRMSLDVRKKERTAIESAGGRLDDVEILKITMLELLLTKTEGRVPLDGNTGAEMTEEAKRLNEMMNSAVKMDLENSALKISKNAEKVIPKLIGTLVEAANKNEKIVLAIDLGLGEGAINTELRKLIITLSAIDGNNADLKRFLKNLIIVKGEGSGLAQRITALTSQEKNPVKPENVIVITKGMSVNLYGELLGKATIAGIEDQKCTRGVYIPLLEIMLFVVGKHLGWSPEVLRDYYNTIPNLNALLDEEALILFGNDSKTLLFKFIPSAQAFEGKILQDLMSAIRGMLTRA